VIRRAAHLVVSARGNGHATLPGASPPPSAAESERVAGGKGATGEGSDGEDSGGEVEAPVTFDVKEALAELEDQGIVLRDPDRGLIDFRALHSGREVLLCWQLGEEDLGWWHLPEDGFAGRRPLPLPPEL
jgi:hypothetical protein